MILALLLQAAQPVACPSQPVAVAPFGGWSTAIGAKERLEVGRAAIVPLQRDATLPVVPGKAAAAGSHARAIPFAVAAAGTYRVALDSPVWIDVVRGGRAVASTAHGHGPACSGIRKIVDFKLAPGRYVLQLSGAAKPQATVMIARGG